MSSMLREIATVRTQIKAAASDTPMTAQVEPHSPVKTSLIKEAIVIDCVGIAMKLLSFQKISM